MSAIVKKGDHSGDVKLCQEQLTRHAYVCVTDGDFGAKTEAQVKAFQEAHGLTDDGIVGAATWNALAAVPGATYAHGVVLNNAMRSKIDALAAALLPQGVPVHITSGDRTAQQQAQAMLSLPNLDAYGKKTQAAFANEPRTLERWTQIVTDLQAKYGTFSDDHMDHRSADVRTRNLDERQGTVLRAEALKLFDGRVGRITSHLHLNVKG